MYKNLTFSSSALETRVTETPEISRTLMVVHRVALYHVLCGAEMSASGELGNLHQDLAICTRSRAYVPVSACVYVNNGVRGGSGEGGREEKRWRKDEGCD